MLRILWNSKSAMIANQEKLDAISNNMSNASTDGYKKIDVSFKDLVQETLDRNGYPISENELRKVTPFTGTGVRAVQWTRDNTQGSMNQTEKNTDLAIDGEGFFQVIKSNGELEYTRSGKFELDSEGRLTDSKGNILKINFNNGDKIKLTKDNFTINEFGYLLVKDQGDYNVVGNIPLYNATGTDAYSSVGESRYVLNEGAELYEVNNSSILQGYIENSNVDIGEEMVEMLITQRAFELGSKGIKTADDMWGIANNLRGK